jgi:hypothetical protein
MSDLNTAPEVPNVQEVSTEDVELALKLLVEWHKQKKLAFAVVNSGAGIMVSSGNAFELEGALNHAHKMVEYENGSRLVELEQMRKGVAANRPKN